jgi:hypothetical protein
VMVVYPTSNLSSWAGVASPYKPAGLRASARSY